MTLCQGCGIREGKRTQLGEYLCNICVNTRNNMRDRRPTPRALDKMLDGIRLPAKRRTRPFRRYKCLACKSIISQRGHHLETEHDIDRFFLRQLEGDNEDSKNYFDKYFIESTEPLSCIGKNYNLPLKESQRSFWNE